MRQKLQIIIPFLLFLIAFSCEKKIVDTDPLFKYQSLGEGKILFTHEAKNATSFEWDFGDGSAKSNEENPSHSYQKNNDYTVILIAKNKKSQVVKTAKVTVSDAPKPITKFSYKSLGNGKIEFLNESQNAESYVWSFGEGGSSTDQNPQYQYITNGTYEVKLSAKNTNGVSENKQNITIADAPKPIADFSINYGGSGFVSFTNLSNNATSYQWSFGNGQTSTAQSPSINYSANGNYSVTLTAKNSNGENTIVKTASISSIFVPTTGQVVFWSQIGKRINIYVSSTYRGVLTKYMLANTPPNCGQEGFVTVTLPQGAYSYSAETDEFFSTKWSGTINVTNGQCRTVQLTQ